MLRLLSPLLFLLVGHVLARPNPQTPEQLAAGEAQLEAEWASETSLLAAYANMPYQTSIPASELAAETSMLHYYATASFSDIPYATSIPASLLAQLEATGTYYDLPKQTDPCGPAVQDGTEFDTCTVDPDGTRNEEGSPFVYYTEEPAPYGVQCLPLPNANKTNGFSNAPAVNASSLNISNCDIDEFCDGMVTDNFPKNQWVWNTNGGPGCAVGMYMPGAEGVAKKPDATRCKRGIYGTMGLYCAEGGPSSEIAAVNLRRLPAGNGDTGEAANAGYASYILAPYIWF
ncbi:MAG: hypothetical protein Q9181_007842 [Wetmoreana brouardii]